MYAVASSARRSSSQDAQLLEEVEEQGDVVPLRPRVSRRQCAQICRRLDARRKSGRAQIALGPTRNTGDPTTFRTSACDARAWHAQLTTASGIHTKTCASACRVDATAADVHWPGL